MSIIIEFNDMLRGFDSFESGLIRYLSSAPEESLSNEHNLMVARRSVLSECQKLEMVDSLPLVLTEPSLWQAVKAYIPAGNQNVKTLNQIKYEIARLLSESGFSLESLSLYDQIIEHEPEHSLLTYYAKDWKAIALQNLGIHHQAKLILEELSMEVVRLDDFNIKYFVFKHYATILRRVHFYELADYKEAIFSHLEHSRACIPAGKKLAKFTYHVDFSKGYVHYLLGEYEKAREMYEACAGKLQEINPKKDEYYLLYIKYALCLMRLNSDSKSIRSYISRFENALVEYPNYKSDLNNFLLTIIRLGQSGGVIDINQKAHLKKLVNTPEDLYCIETDIKCILSYHRSLSERASFLINVLDDARNRFQSFDTILNPLVTEVATTTGVAVCFDLRNFTGIMNMHPGIAIRFMNILRAKLYAYFIGHFDDVIFNGDGFILVKLVEDNLEGAGNANVRMRCTNFILSILNRLPKLFDELDLERNEKNVPISIGVGLSCGKLFFPTPNRTLVPVFGDPLNHSKRMCDLAKPSGVVIHYLNDFIDKDKIHQVGEFEEKEAQGKTANEKFNILYSPQAIDNFKYTFIYKTDIEYEKRVFLQYGIKCSNSCLYCLSGKGSDRLKQLDIDTLLNELKDINITDDYLLSIGHLNEALDSNNWTGTVEIVTRLLSSQHRIPIQIATKVPINKIWKFIEEIKGKVQYSGVSSNDVDNRLYVLYSLCSIQYSEELEGRKIEFDDNFPRQRNIIPFIKPFLPGITDIDEILVGMICRFDNAIVGYPYLSIDKMRQLSMFCLNYGIECNDYYNFYKQLVKLDSALGSTKFLSHPSLFNRKLYPFDYFKELEAFIKKILIRKPNINIFRSSPCAIAFLRKQTCYTHVGRPDNPIREILCRADCPNDKCQYNNANAV